MKETKQDRMSRPIDKIQKTLKRYRTPRLKEYGHVTKLTNAGGASERSDHGNDMMYP